MRLVSSICTRVISAILVPAIALGQSASAWHVDTLRQSVGLTWHRLQSRHFIVYSEYRGTRAQAHLDSLEAAWAHDLALLGTNEVDTTAITVFVTASRMRFPRIMTPVTKGTAGPSADGRDVIVLVQNDSVRLYARHEVMHVLARRAWGLGPMANGEWFREGLATFADGACQGIPLSATARDLLHGQPSMTSARLRTEFTELHRSSRATAYVFAGSFVEYLWSARGRDGVERLWKGNDSIPAAGALIGLPFARSALDGEWRAYTEHAARGRAGVAPDALLRHGCG